MIFFNIEFMRILRISVKFAVWWFLWVPKNHDCKRVVFWYWLIHPWRLAWNIIMEVWKVMFLSKWVISRFHVNLPGCRIFPNPVGKVQDATDDNGRSQLWSEWSGGACLRIGVLWSPFLKPPWNRLCLSVTFMTFILWYTLKLKGFPPHKRERAQQVKCVLFLSSMCKQQQLLFIYMGLFKTMGPPISWNFLMLPTIKGF